MSDQITLPREVVQLALEALEWSWGGEPIGTMEREAITALRTALAAEQPKPKPEPVGWQERHIYPNASGWSVWYPCRWRLAHEPLEQLEQSGITYQWRPVYAIDAAMGDKR